MKYNKVRLSWGPAAGDMVIFDLDEINPTTPYVVKSISGLEPPAINVAIDDGVIQGSRPERREIVMLLSLQPNYELTGDAREDPGILRKRLYPMLAPKFGGVVTFRLFNSTPNDWVQTTGKVKRIESNPFTQDPEVQITMSCVSPYFEEALFTHASPGTLSAKATIPITNVGDVPMGFLLNHVMTASMPSYTLFNDAAGKQLRINQAFLAEDRIIINTERGVRRAERWRATQQTFNLLPYIDPTSDWLLLDPGPNVLRPGNTNYRVEGLSYTAKHWGF